MAKKITIPFTELFNQPKKKRAPKAVKKIKKHLAKRFHTPLGQIMVSQKTNEKIFERGQNKIPRRIQLMVQTDKGKVKAFHAGETIPKKPTKKEQKKEEKKPKKTKKAKKETKEKREKEKELKKKKKEKRAKEKAAEKTAIKRKTGRV